MTSEPIHFFVSGCPIAQPRPHARAMYVKKLDRWVAQVYDPNTANEWKNLVMLAAKPVLPKERLTGPVSLRIEFFMPRPLSHFRTGRNSGVLKENAPKYHTGRPDLDNIEKSTADALTDVGMWKEDGQVCEKYTTKNYAAIGTCGASITITPLE